MGSAPWARRIVRQDKKGRIDQAWFSGSDPIMERLLKSRYRLIEEIGRGGMAVVYRGEDTELNRQVAVKILHSFLADKEEARKRFQREAQVVARLRHENILEIYDFSGLDSPEAFIVTEFIEGQTLAAFLEKHPIEVPEVAACIVSQVCKAVVHAHRHGVIHRDIKPENIMIRSDGVLKLMDFGIAQMVDTQKLTLTGQLLGSPAYMAPEMVTGAPLDFRTDVFSLGVLLYRLATGELPFSGNNPHEVLKKIADGDFLPASMVCPAVSEELDTIIDKALTVDPELRYQSAEAFDEAVTGLIADMGRSDPETETKLFFADAEAYQETMRQQLVAFLLKEARELGHSGRLSTALRHLNRILFLDEHNQEVPKLLSWIQRKQALGDMLRRSAQLLGVFVLVGAAGAAIWVLSTHASRGNSRSAQGTSAPLAAGRRNAQTMHPDGAAPQALSIDAGPRLRDAAVPSARNPTQREPRARATKTRGTRTSRTARPRPNEPRQFVLLPYPTSVKVSVDGGPAKDYGPDTRTLLLGPGPHTVRLSSPYCYPRTIRIAPKENAGVLKARLKWRPALLTVRTNVPSDIQAGGIIGVSSRPIRVPIPLSSQDGTTKVLVKASASGYHTVRRLVALQAGQASTVRLRLDPL